jgi:hypothetical protein
MCGFWSLTSFTYHEFRVYPCVSTSFLFVLESVYHILFLHQLTLFGLFLLLGIISDVAVNVYVQIFMFTCFHFS